MKTFKIIHITAAVIGLVVVLRLADNLRPTFNENLVRFPASDRKRGPPSGSLTACPIFPPCNTFVR